MCIMPLPHTFIYSAFRRTFHDANWMRIQHAISIIYVKIFTFSLHAKNSIITVVTYANWKLLVIGHRCEALRACDVHLMGIKCTCEGGIHRFTMFLKRIRKRNTVEQHQVVSLRSQIVGV
jgi:hypothetical protein